VRRNEDLQACIDQSGPYTPRFNRTLEFGASGGPVGQPQGLQVGGKSFDRLNLTVHIGAGIASGSQVVLLYKGYLLMLVFTAPEDVSRDKLAQTIQSVHFSEK